MRATLALIRSVQPLRKIRRFTILLAGLCFFLASCASRPLPRKFQDAGQSTSFSQNKQAVSLSEDQERLRAAAEKLLGQPPESVVVVNGRNFTLDCIGTVQAVFFSLHMDVARDFPRYSGNGVKRLYETLKQQNLLHKDSYPRTGDVIFWDNTYDANDDGDLTNDPLTHAGVVLTVEEDGTIHYVHSHVLRGVIIEVMNLLRPGDYYDEAGKNINSALAMGSGISRPKNPTHWLSGDLWKSFGGVLGKKDYFFVDPRITKK
jgi:hypothetical protein